MVVCDVMNSVIALFSCVFVYCFGVCACCSARKRVRAEETGVPLHSYPRRGLTGSCITFPRCPNSLMQCPHVTQSCCMQGHRLY